MFRPWRSGMSELPNDGPKMMAQKGHGGKHSNAIWPFLSMSMRTLCLAFRLGWRDWGASKEPTQYKETQTVPKKRSKNGPKSPRHYHITPKLQL